MSEIEMTPTVFLVDDDASVRSALTRALTAEGFHVLSWASADAFLADYDPDKPGQIGTLDRHGNPNVLTLDKGTSKLAQGPSSQTALVEVEPWTKPVPAIGAFDPPPIVPA